jgi:hypothetical protein
MRRRRSKTRLKFWAIGGMLLALLGWVGNPRNLLSARAPSEPCEQIVQPQAILTREQLSQLLTIPERSPKAKIRAVVKSPYCNLAAIEVRANVMAEREAYPLGFDAQTWLVILYEGDEYAGYAFSFRR